MKADWRCRRLAIAVGAVFVAGCTTMENGQPDRSGANADSECNAVATALIGAVAGALIGGKQNRAGGAAIGAGVGALACVAWNYRSRQTRSAEQVKEEYRSRNQGQLPVETKVLRYDSSLGQGARIRAGGQLTIGSNIEIVQGTNSPPPNIEEELTLHRPDGKDTVVRKKANDGTSAGAFTTSFSMTMPAGVPQGQYPVRTTLFVDGRPVASRDLQLQVVAAPGASPSARAADLATIFSTAGG